MSNNISSIPLSKTPYWKARTYLLKYPHAKEFFDEEDVAVTD